MVEQNCFYGVLGQDDPAVLGDGLALFIDHCVYQGMLAEGFPGGDLPGFAQFQPAPEPAVAAVQPQPDGGERTHHALAGASVLGKVYSGFFGQGVRLLFGADLLFCLQPEGYEFVPAKSFPAARQRPGSEPGAEVSCKNRLANFERYRRAGLPQSPR